MTVTDHLRDGTRWAAAEVLERLPLLLLGDGSPLIALTALVVGAISAWPDDNHPAFLTSHGGHLEVYAWVLALLAGAGLIVWGLVSRQWRVHAAGLMLAGSGLTVYGIAFALASGTDSAAVGVPPMVLGVGAAIRIVIVSALGITWEARTGANDDDDGGREGIGGD